MRRSSSFSGTSNKAKVYTDGAAPLPIFRRERTPSETAAAAISDEFDAINKELFGDMPAPPVVSSEGILYEEFGHVGRSHSHGELQHAHTPDKFSAPLVRFGTVAESTPSAAPAPFAHQRAAQSQHQHLPARPQPQYEQLPPSEQPRVQYTALAPDARPASPQQQINYSQLPPGH